MSLTRDAGRAGFNMPGFILSYDLKDNESKQYSELKNKLAQSTWYGFINYPGGKSWPHLPNTTFQGNFANLGVAEAAFITAVQQAEQSVGFPIVVRKYMIAEYADIRVVSDTNLDDT